MTFNSSSVVLLTGAYGFIGSHMLKELSQYSIKTICLDSLTSAAINFPGYSHNSIKFDSLGNRFYHLDLNDNLDDIFKDNNITHIIHMAAESHVDNSIEDPGIFARTNIIGTLNLLNYAVKHKCKMVLVSTDEVYGSSNAVLPPFTIDSILNPSSPYSASKASAEMLAMSYATTYGLNLIITRCVNNFGLGQHPEKFLPKLINCIKNNVPFPLYGTGNNVRQWIHASSHCKEIIQFILLDIPGIYNIGSSLSLSNIEMIDIVKKTLNKDETLVKFVQDRKGHDFMYKISNDSYTSNTPNSIKKMLHEYIKQQYDKS